MEGEGLKVSAMEQVMQRRLDLVDDLDQKLIQKQEKKLQEDKKSRLDNKYKSGDSLPCDWSLKT